ncbi:MAG: DUF1778 domain-containing protein [Gammaproteobacteria bacterium]|jgi:uncharacterized protein (DUF1778 family)|nr:DUF1778 domain-containing protein [Gammaproteobacteria bacterium]
MSTRTRQERFEFRTTPAVRELVEQAARESGGSLTEFAEASLIAAAQRVLADRNRFALSDEALSAWERINARPARELPGVHRLMDRPSPFDQ